MTAVGSIGILIRCFKLGRFGKTEKKKFLIVSFDQTFLFKRKVWIGGNA
jgi:hypothetical protein